MINMGAWQCTNRHLHPQEAIHYLKIAVKEDPDCYPVQLLLGEVYLYDMKRMEYWELAEVISHFFFSPE